MSRRGIGRAAWQPPASMDEATVAAVGRVFDTWVRAIETPRAGLAVARAGQIRFDRTRRRCVSIATVLRGSYGRQRADEADLVAAIEAYAADGWHASRRAWLTLTDWFADDDVISLWVNKAWATRGRRASGDAAIAAAAARREAEIALAERAVRRRKLAAERMAWMAAHDKWSLDQVVANAFAGMDGDTQLRCRREAGGDGSWLTVTNSPTLRAAAISRLADLMDEEMEREGTA